MNPNTTEANEASLVFFQDIPQVVFHTYTPEFSSNVLRDIAGWTTLLDSAGATHAAQALTKTATPDTNTPVNIGSKKINSNHTRPAKGQGVKPILNANPDSGITSAYSSGGSEGDSEYVESTGKLFMRSANMPDLAGRISELEMMQKVSEGEINANV